MTIKRQPGRLKFLFIKQFVILFCHPVTVKLEAHIRIPFFTICLTRPGFHNTSAVPGPRVFSYSLFRSSHPVHARLHFHNRLAAPETIVTMVDELADPCRHWCCSLPEPFMAAVIPLVPLAFSWHAGIIQPEVTKPVLTVCLKPVRNRCILPHY